jgi:hypothetical protein
MTKAFSSSESSVLESIFPSFLATEDGERFVTLFFISFCETSDPSSLPEEICLLISSVFVPIVFCGYRFLFGTFPNNWLIFGTFPNNWLTFGTFPNKPLATLMKSHQQLAVTIIIRTLSFPFFFGGVFGE